MLAIKDLVAGYGKMKVLKGVSFKVEAGSFTAILGGNGCGKSTTLKVISGLVPALSGDVLFEGRSLLKVAPHNIVKLGIAHVTQGKDVFPSMTVEENLRLGAYTVRDKAEIRTETERVLSLFPRLKERLKQHSGLLSGGEQQMLAIARGLMSRPKLLILDEPSAALSPKLTEEIFANIARIHETGMTVLLVEQNVRMALKVADYTYILQEGRVAFEDTAHNLLQHKDIKSFYLGEASKRE